MCGLGHPRHTLAPPHVTLFIDRALDLLIRDHLDFVASLTDRTYAHERVVRCLPWLEGQLRFLLHMLARRWGRGAYLVHALYGSVFCYLEVLRALLGPQLLLRVDLHALAVLHDVGKALASLL